MSEKEKIEDSAASRQASNADLVEGTRMATRKRWKHRLRALQDGTVGASGSSSNRLPDHAAMVAEAKLRGAVTNNGAVGCALA